SDGTQITANLNLSNTALVGGHGVQITQFPTPYSNTFGVGLNFTVFAAGTPSPYTVSPTQGTIGTSVPITINGQSLGNINAIQLFLEANRTFVVATGLTPSAMAAQANSLTANLTIGNGAMIGPHGFYLSNPAGTLGVNTSFNVLTSNGTTVTGSDPPGFHRGD